MKTRFVQIDSHAVGLADRVFDELGAAILDGRLPPGQLLRDNELAETLGVSRTPVREAIQRLSRIGLVEVVASRFTRVTTPSPAQIAETLIYTGYQAGVATHIAVGLMTDDQRREALRLADAMIEASGRDHVDDLYANARALFGFMTDVTGNEVFITIMRETSLTMERNLRMMQPVLWPAELRRECYQGLRDAIERGDADEAERWVRCQHGIPVAGAPVRSGDS